MNLYEEITTQWIPLAKMESASEEVYRERIEKAYSVVLPHQILTKVPYVGTEEIVSYQYDELIGLCPVTFLPDLYKLTLRFIPDKYVCFGFFSYLFIFYAHNIVVRCGRKIRSKGNCLRNSVRCSGTLRR